MLKFLSHHRTTNCEQHVSDLKNSIGYMKNKPSVSFNNLMIGLFKNALGNITNLRRCNALTINKGEIKTQII